MLPSVGWLVNQMDGQTDTETANRGTEWNDE